MRFIPYLLFAISTFLFLGNFLDDTFIHLRYARNFLDTSRFEYNPGDPSFGCSAPLYVWLMVPILALLPENFWPILPKLISIGCHFGVLLVSLIVWRERGYRYAPLWVPALICTPLVTRWMQDGMETSLAVFLCFVAVACLSRLQPTRTTLALFILAASLVGGLRLDLLPHGLCLVAAGLLFWRRWILLVPVFVMLVPHAIMWFTFGSILPDTAVAKHGGGFNPSWGISAVRSVAAMHPIWLAAMISPLVAAWSLLRSPPQDKIRAACLVVLWTPVVAVFFSGMMRNQILHGARYFMPSLSLAGFGCIALMRPLWLTKSPLGGVLAVSALLLSWGMCLALAPKIETMRQGIQTDFPKELNSSISILAFDIGILGWESDARIVDGSRLVNGRQAAKMSTDLWFKQISRNNWADYLMLDDEDTLVVLLNTPGANLTENNRVLTLPQPEREPAIFDIVKPVMSQQNVGQSLSWNLWKRR
jgi:hypothetical protein